MARGLDGVLAEVAARSGGVWRAGNLGARGLRGCEARLFGRGWGLLFGTFKVKHFNT